MKIHQKKDDAAHAFSQQMQRALASSERFMAAIWTIGADGFIHMERTTFDFPFQDVAPAINILKDHMAADLGLDHSPLPMAPDFAVAPALRMHDAAGENEEAVQTGVVVVEDDK